MYIRIAFSALVMAMLAAMPNPAAADDSVIGTILEVEGTATVTQQGKTPITAAVDGAIHLNDRIETGPQSRVFILFIDNTQWTLSENTKFTVDDYVYDADNNTDNKGRYSVLEGAFQYVSGLIAKKPNPDVQIETPAGSIGIRGTDITGGDIDGEYGIDVDEGAIDVTTDKGQVRVNAGEGTMVKGRQFAPSRPAKWKQERRDRLRQKVFLKRRELVQQRMTGAQERHKLMRERFKQYMLKHRKTQLQQLQKPGQRKLFQPGQNFRRRYGQ
ncbi:MAG: FecR domain-containing protein [Alphaproteobacteria bacterium]